MCKISIMTRDSHDTKQATICWSRKTHQPTFEIHMIYNHIYIYSYTFNFYPVIWNLLCIFVVFHGDSSFWKEHHIYISLRKVSVQVRTPRLDIDEFQAALRKVRVFKSTSKMSRRFLGDILFHGSGRWWWTLSLLPQNLGNMEALSPIIWAKWPLKKEGCRFPWYIVLWCFLVSPLIALDVCILFTLEQVV